jgi:L-methionine (R)-S-oxide reductase
MLRLCHTGGIYVRGHDGLLQLVRATASQAADARELMDAVVQLLKAERPHYSWVGFYLMAGPSELAVGPYAGKATPHIRIPLNQGICGAAASSGESLIIDDVNSDPRYLACSLETRSEIVVPIKRDGRVLGEIDIDSDQPAAFSAADQRLLEEIAEIVAARL